MALGETARAADATCVDTSALPRAATDDVTLVPGEVFRGLKIHALLGAGAMGNAYLASHGSLRTPVVVKLFRPSGTDPLAEAHLAARVVSPAVVPVLDAGVRARHRRTSCSATSTASTSRSCSASTRPRRAASRCRR